MLRLVAIALACLVLQFPAALAAQPSPRMERSALRISGFWTSDFAHPFVAARTPRTAPPAREPAPEPRRGLNMIVAGSGLAVGALLGMVALRGPSFRCGPSRGYTYWPAGLAAGTGILITFAGWGELHRTSREQRSLNRRQRIGLPFLAAGSALLGTAPLLLQAAICRD